MQELPLHVLGGREDQLVALAPGQFSSRVQGQGHVLELVHVIRIDEEHVVQPALADEPPAPVYLVGLELLARGGKEDVPGQLLIARQRRPAQHGLPPHGTPDLEVAERAAKPGLEGRILCGGHALDDPPHPLRGDRIHVVLALDQHETAVAAVLPVQRQDRLGGSAGAGEGVEDDGVLVGGDLEDAFQEADRLHGGKVREIIGEKLQEGSLGILGVTDFLVRPDRLRNQTLLYLRKESLDGRDLVFVLTPPDSTIFVHPVKVLLRIAPEVTRWRSFDDSPARTCNGIDSLAVRIASRQVAGFPRPARVVVRIAVTGIGFIGSRQQAKLELVLHSRIDQDEIVVFGEVLGAALGGVNLLPNHGRHEVVFPEHLVHQRA